MEDQPDLRRLLRGFLEDEGFAVDSAADGNEGLAKLLTNPYDIVVLDLMLPKIDGCQILQRLRMNGCKTPVLVLSARDTLPDRVKGLDIGADDYLTKPFERQELLARVRAIIRRTAGQYQSIIEIDDVSIDLRSKSVKRAGEPISLTAREFSLLEYLLLHRGRVMHREELLDHLSDECDESNSNVLDVYVSNIRKKLGGDLIQTRRGLGYVIAE